MTRELLKRAWAAGAGPGAGPLAIDLDSTICEISIAVRQRASIRRMIEARPEDALRRSRCGSTAEPTWPRRCMSSSPISPGARP